MNKITEVFLTGKQFQKLYDQSISRAAKKFRMTRMEMEVILFFINNPEMNTAKDVADYRMYTKSNVSKAVELLIRKGYLTGKEDPNDRRIVRLHLEEKAGPVCQAALKEQEDYIETLYHGVTKEERATMIRVIEKMAVNARLKL